MFLLVLQCAVCGEKVTGKKVTDKKKQFFTMIKSNQDKK